MSDLRQVFAAILPLLISLGILVLGNGLFSTLLAVRMGIEEFPVDRIGLIMAAYSVGFVLGTLRCPVVVERVGHIRAFAAFAAIAAISALVHAIVIDPIVWLLLRVVAGFCLAGLFTITESWINASSSNTVRGQVLSVYMTVNYLSYGASQSLLTVIDPGGFQIFSLVAILVALSLVPLALSRTQTPGSVGTHRLRMIEIIRISPLGVAGCIGAGLINGAFGSMAPVYVQARGGSVEDVGLFMMVAIFSGFVMQFPMGRLSDRFDRRTVFLGAIAGVSAAALSLAFADNVPNVVFAIMLGLYGGLSYSIYPIALAHANDFMRAEEIVPGQRRPAADVRRRIGGRPDPRLPRDGAGGLQRAVPLYRRHRRNAGALHALPHDRAAGETAGGTGRLRAHAADRHHPYRDGVEPARGSGQRGFGTARLRFRRRSGTIPETTPQAEAAE